MRNIARRWSLCLRMGLTFALTPAYLTLLFSSSAPSQGGGEVPGARFEFALIGDMRKQRRDRVLNSRAQFARITFSIG